MYRVSENCYEKSSCRSPFTLDKSTKMTMPLNTWSSVEFCSLICYSQTTEKLISAIHHRVPWFFTPDTAACTCQGLQCNWWEVLVHLPYRPDLVSFNFVCLGLYSIFLLECKLTLEVQGTALKPDSYYKGVDNIVSWCNKCLNI
jgi:hypothetical protein